MSASSRPKRTSTLHDDVDHDPPSPPLVTIKDEPGPQPEPIGGTLAGPSHLILRRSTRLSLDLPSYAYAPATSSTATTTTAPRKRVKRELPITPESKSRRPPTTPRSSSKKMPLLALEKPHKEPERWREQYRLIEKMRRGIVAPVDDMGCERPRTTTDADPKTKDPVTSAAVTNLHHTLPGGLTAQSLADASIEMVHECINKVGFWRRKTEYIQDAARSLLQQPGEEKGDVPKTLEGLCELKGVGPKMAFLCLQCAWDINAGIGVDVHVHRITNRLRWHKPQTTNPEQTRLNLQSWLPSELHKPINPMMVGFGQVICLPVGPRCDHCLLGKAKICPSRISNIKSEGRKEVVYTFSDIDDEGGNAKVEIGYDEDESGYVKRKSPDSPLVRVKKEEELEEPGLSQEGVLDVLDQVDGSKEIGPLAAA